MHVITATNIRDALPLAVDYLMNFGLREQTRLGEVLASPMPVTIWYQNPKQHVLLNRVRDANPFFHLMEAMWMLAGRDDSAFLDSYIKDFGKRFAVDGVVLDAYGQRWRYGLKYNQLDAIVHLLHNEPTSRQAVLQMWGAGRDDLRAYSAKPCNLAASFHISKDLELSISRLDMTVFNRSNDLIWGCCGANAVHFPILQEYIAGRLGLEVGYYWQVTTNLHLYQFHINMMEKRMGGGELLTGLLTDSNPDRYERTQPLMMFPSVFDEELQEVMGWIDDIHQNREVFLDNISNRFLRDTVLPMAMAHQHYKNEEIKLAFEHMATVTAEDWREAGKQWLNRRCDEQVRYRQQLMDRVSNERSE
jgi:thymidylate synthase